MRRGRARTSRVQLGVQQSPELKVAVRSPHICVGWNTLQKAGHGDECLSVQFFPFPEGTPQCHHGSCLSKLGVARWGERRYWLKVKCETMESPKRWNLLAASLNAAGWTDLSTSWEFLVSQGLVREGKARQEQFERIVAEEFENDITGPSLQTRCASRLFREGIACDAATVPDPDGHSAQARWDHFRAATAIDHTMELQPGKVLQGRYTITRKLGQGGQGVVYGASDPRRGRGIVAIKEVLLDDSDLGQTRRDAFAREAQILCNLESHSNLALGLEFFEEGGRSYLVMEYVSGKDLSAIVTENNGHPLPVSRVVEWADSLLGALTFLHGHDRPVIHRDIQPRNIKLTESGCLKLLDFGLAKGSATGSTVIPRSVFGFSKGYSSPEQRAGDLTDVRSDLYSLGATLYFLLSGVPPPDSLDSRERAIVKGLPDPLRHIQDINPKVPAHVSRLIHQALELDPAKRPVSAQEMRSSLETASPHLETRSGSSIAEGSSQMMYAIDGSNVLLGVRVNKKPSVRLFARLLQALREQGIAFQVCFDNSLKHHMAREGVAADWNALVGWLTAAGIEPTESPRADDAIQELVRSHGAWVINGGDKVDSWRAKPQRMHRVRVRRNRDQLHLLLIDDQSGSTVLQVPAHEPFDFGGIRFPALDSKAAVLENVIAPDSRFSKRQDEGILLVLALDASGSMNQLKSFDGRPKHAHLNEIVKSAIVRLKRAAIADGLYIAILRFESDVTPLLSPTGALFCSVFDWFSSLETFDYLNGVTMRQTNIRLALQRAKELIQNTLADIESVRPLADEWRAAVILITDGKHEVARADGSGVLESDADVGEALDIYEGVAGLVGRLDVGCVGIGSDANLSLLDPIASPCTPRQRRLAATSGIDKLLRNGRLSIHVDSENPAFSEAVRAFIDVASSSH